jgi:hypothetical protein
MATDGRHKDVEWSSSCSRNCIDAIERHSVWMGVHKAKKFFSLRGKTANSGQCGQKINNRPTLISSMRPFTGQSATKTIKIATVVMTDMVLTGREQRAVSDDEVT